MPGLLACCLLLRSRSWRVCMTVGKERVRGPTRQSKAAAQEDLGRLQDSDAAELQSAVARLHQEVADTGAACDREARFREVVLAETRNCLELEQDTDHGLALESARLLVASCQEIKALSESTAGKLLLETNDLFDQLSRPLGTAGFDPPVACTGLKNLRNSCWLNAVLQCFHFCGSLQIAFTEESMIGSMVKDVLLQLGNNKWDYVAPFGCLRSSMTPMITN